GQEADLVLLDTAIGSVAGDALEALKIGDTPGIAAVLIDGQVKLTGSRNTPPPTRRVSVQAV
ncbi:MAG: hypothetical protein KDE04_06645, partial [Anaerolineales bacterium]|nr:hypothetical protein [Anaerolineales bacterium]